MSLENYLFTALSAIPEVARTGPSAFAVHPTIFPQAPRYNPRWPAIRYTFISSVPIVDQCGDGDDDTADTRVQIDIVSEDSVTTRFIRLEVRNIMAAFNPPAILELDFDGDYDEDTKTYRWIMHYNIQPSSGSGSP